jgi:hypothetical protein
MVALLLLGAASTATAAPPAANDAAAACTPPRQLLWNGVCLPAAAESGHHVGWPPNLQLNRSAVDPPYLHELKPSTINITTGRQLLLDGFLTQTSTGLRTVFHSPTYDEAANNPVIRPDKPWEINPTPY